MPSSLGEGETGEWAVPQEMDARRNHEALGVPGTPALFSRAIGFVPNRLHFPSCFFNTLTNNKTKPTET
jgi:hypothetical protein